VLNTVSGRLLACGPHAGLGRAGGAGRGSVWSGLRSGSGPKERCVEQHQEEQQLQSVPEAVRVVLRSRRLRVDLLRRRLALTCLALP